MVNRTKGCLHTGQRAWLDLERHFQLININIYLHCSRPIRVQVVDLILDRYAYEICSHQYS